MAYHREEGTRTAHALYRGLQLTPGFSVRDIARRMGIAESRLYDWAENRQPFPVHMLGRLVAAVAEVDQDRALVLAGELLDAPGLEVRPASRAAPSPEGLAVDLLHLGELTGRVQETGVAALADGRVDEEERAEIERAARPLHRWVQSLIAKVAGGERRQLVMFGGTR